MVEGVAADGRGLRHTVKLPPSLPSRTSSFLPPPPPAPKPPICILPIIHPLYPFFRLPRRLRVHHPCLQSGRSFWTESTPLGYHSSLCLRSTRPRMGDGAMCDAERDPVRAKITLTWTRSRVSQEPPAPPSSMLTLRPEICHHTSRSNIEEGGVGGWTPAPRRVSVIFARAGMGSLAQSELHIASCFWPQVEDMFPARAHTHGNTPGACPNMRKQFYSESTPGVAPSRRTEQAILRPVHRYGRVFPVRVHRLLVWSHREASESVRLYFALSTMFSLIEWMA